jgi:aspartate racemase
MAAHVGIVACSAEGAALCYRTIALESQERMGEHGHPRVTLDSIPMAEHMAFIRAADWRGVGELMLDSAGRVAAAGAAFAICPDNTVHQSFPFFVDRSPVPFLHIAEVVAEEARRRGYRKLAILGTRYLMESEVYPGALAPRGIGYEIPDAGDRERIHTIIFRELVNGVFPERSRLDLNGVMETLAARGCDAAALACTELPLIVRSDDAPLPTLDSTRLLARAAIARALAESE